MRGARVGVRRPSRRGRDIDGGFWRERGEDGGWAWLGWLVAWNHCCARLAVLVGCVRYSRSNVLKRSVAFNCGGTSHEALGFCRIRDGMWRMIPTCGP